LEYRSLGRTGVKVSPMCIGSFNFSDPTPEDEAHRIVERALAAGINFFDTADSYHDGESERLLGKSIAMLRARQQVVIISKSYFPTGPGPNERGNSRLHILRSCEASLRRLGTDYIDVFLLHRPSFDMAHDESLGALDDLVRQGKVRYIGCSLYPAWKVMEGLMVSESRGMARYVLEQPPYNLLDRRIENELVPLCLSHGLGIAPFAPLAQGVLAGRYSEATRFPADSRAARLGGTYAGRVNQRGIEVGRAIAALAQQHGISAAELALLWVKDQPGITAPVFGARTLAQLEQVLPVLEMRLAPELGAAIDELVAPGSAVTDYHNSSGWMKQVLNP
jgi:aryl-alcohol dehydrogenase-like predicted oxidoreductase